MKTQFITTILAIAFSTAVFAEGGPAAVAGDPAAGQSKAAVCAACHGVDGNSANPEWPTLAGQNAGYLAKQLADFKAGADRSNPLMAPIVASLSEQDIADLAAWFAAQSAAGRTADRALVEAGERLYRGGDNERGVPACSACHGPRGEGNPGGAIPAVAGQHAQYTYTQLKAFHADARKNDPNGMMRGTVRWMTDAEMLALAAYLQGLH